MGFLRNVISKAGVEQGANYMLGHSVASSSVANLFGTGGDSINLMQEYSGFVWKAVNIRSEELSSYDFYVQRFVKDQWVDDQNHEFTKVMEGGEGNLDEAEFIEAHQVYMDMYGESFWYFSKGERSSKPFDRYLLDPNYVTVMIAGDKVTGYVYQKEGSRVVFDLDEIAHYRIFNPANKFRGAGPMQKAGWFIRSNRYSVTFVNNFLENNAIPAGVIVAKDTVDDDDWKLFKEQWANNYGGVANTGKTAFVRGNNLEFVKTGISLGDVDFEKVTNSSKTDILEMFSIPKSKLGDFGDFNRASAVQSDKTWAKTFTKQAVSRIERKLSKKVTNWYGPGLRFGSNFVVPEDREQKLKEFEAGTGVWVTVNEARGAYGLPPLGAEFDTIAVKQDSATQPTAAKSLGKVTIRTKNTKASFSYQMKESFRQETEDLQIKYESKFLETANLFFEDQKERVLNQIQPKKYVETRFDVDKETQELEKLLLPIFLELAREQGALALNFAGNDSMDFTLTPVMQKSIADAIRKATKGFNELTQQLIADAVADGINDGSSIADIANEIGDIFKDMLGVSQPGYRLERFARTEVIRGSNAITEQAYKQSGVVRKKEWFANPGHCQYCASLNGSVINLDASFVPAGGTIDGTEGGTYKADYGSIEYPGAHPNCRCTLIPVVEGSL